MLGNNGILQIHDVPEAGRLAEVQDSQGHCEAHAPKLLRQMASPTPCTVLLGGQTAWWGPSSPTLFGLLDDKNLVAINQHLPNLSVLAVQDPWQAPEGTETLPRYGVRYFTDNEPGVGGCIC